MREACLSGSLLALAAACAGCRVAEPTASDVSPWHAELSAQIVEEIAIGRARIELRVPSEPMELSPEELSTWVADSARAVELYYGRLPVEHTIVEVVRTESARVEGGRTLGIDDAVHIRVAVGAEADSGDLARDWVMTHELVHTAMSDLPERHLWLEEGLATYVEPIARAQAGLETAEDVWVQLVEGLPLGLPDEGDRGLDRTPTWGRTYWGGALFCLLADIEIRERTQNRLGLQDALRAIVARGHSTLSSASIERVLAEADAAVGAPVLIELYERHAKRAEHVDLAELWAELGVTLRSGRVVFDDSAPRAGIRRAITRAETVPTGVEFASGEAGATRRGFTRN